MVEAARNVLISTRRRYRQALKVRALRGASRRGHRQGQRVVHMLHVGKTGGTAVQSALTDAPMPVALSLHLHGHGISLRQIPTEDEVFFFLREPVARFVSGFEMRRREGRPRHYRPWTTAERRAFARFDSAEALALALRISDRAQRAEAESAMRAIYHVRSHLRDWLVGEEVVRSRLAQLMFVGWQERLDADFKSLVSLLGLPPSTTLPASEFDANRAAADESERSLSAEAVESLRAWYADDYLLIGLLADLGVTDPPPEVVSALAQVAVQPEIKPRPTR